MQYGCQTGQSHADMWHDNIETIGGFILVGEVLVWTIGGCHVALEVRANLF